MEVNFLIMEPDTTNMPMGDENTDSQDTGADMGGDSGMEEGSEDQAM